MISVRFMVCSLWVVCCFMAGSMWGQSDSGQLKLPKKVLSADRLDEAIQQAVEKGKLLSLLFFDPGAKRREVQDTLSLLDLVDGFSVVVKVERKDIRQLPESLQEGLSSSLIGGKPPAVAVYSPDGKEHVASLASRTIKAMGDVAERDFRRDVRQYREKIKLDGEMSVD